MSRSDLKKDLDKLAKLVYKISEKHGSIYITAIRNERWKKAHASAFVPNPSIDGHYISIDVLYTDIDGGKTCQKS